eukprot:151012-Chlamydomonas_euryale.AAC.1
MLPGTILRLPQRAHSHLVIHTAARTYPQVRICRNAEAAINYNIQHSFIRDFSAKPFNTVTAASVALAKGAMDAQLQAAVVVSNSGEAADVVGLFLMGEWGRGGGKEHDGRAVAGGGGGVEQRGGSGCG